MKRKYCLFIIILLINCRCNKNPVSSEYDDVFSIYLVKDSDKSYTKDKPPLNDFILEDKPLLTINTIGSYHWEKHLISFPTATKEELKKREPLLHFLFVIIANGERIYWGMFLDNVDSYSCSNPVISVLPRHPDLNSIIPNGFIINRANPSYPGNETDKDIREDYRIYNAIKHSGKLIE